MKHRNLDQNEGTDLFYDQEEVREMMYSRVTQEVISYLESHLMDELSLKQVHEKVGYSHFHLLRVFKRETGCRWGNMCGNED